MKQIIKLKESDLHSIIKESVKQVLKEGFWDNFSPDALDDKAYMDDMWAERQKMMDDEWERKNIAIRKKYPGKSREWYEAMLDTFNENKINGNKAINESHGEPDERMALIYDGIIEDYKAQEIADDYDLSEEEAAAEWFKGVAEGGDFSEEEMPLHREYVMDVPALDAELYHDYGAGYYFLVKNDNKQDMPGFEGTWDGLNSLTNPFNESTIKEDLGGTSSFSVNSPAGSLGDPTGQQKNHIDVPFGNVQRRKIYSPKSGAKGDVTKQDSNVDMSPALKRKNGKGGSISIPKRNK